MLTFARFIPAPENCAALVAVQNVAADLGSRQRQAAVNPLFIHGPPGAGKTHLASALIREACRNTPDLIVSVLGAADFNELVPFPSSAPAGESGTAKLLPDEPSPLEALRSCDLLVVEDVQYLPARTAEALVQLFDFLYARQRPMLFTAAAGPRQFVHLPGRLVSRLACGLVVGIDSLAAPGRLALLQDKAQRRQLAVCADALAWLAEHLTGGGRQLEGALIQLETLARLQDRLLDLPAVVRHFRDQVDAARPTITRIARRVCGYFQIEHRQMQSRRRYRNALLPRQLGMYLARQLTGLSLDRIGFYFGGRDHTTVLHACRKVERALVSDASLAAAVHQLQLDLA